MKVEITSDKGKEEINLAGNTIFPSRIPVLSIEHHADKIIFRLCGKYQTKVTHEYDKEKGKADDRLWIIGEVQTLEDQEGSII